MRNEKCSFVMYQSFENMFALLPMEGRGELITAIFAYQKNQMVPEGLSDVVRMAFICMKDTLDRDRQSYLEKCEKLSENGKKGGRPPKRKGLDENASSTKKTNCFFEKAKKADNDNVNDNDNDNDNVNDNDNGNDNEIVNVNVIEEGDGNAELGCVSDPIVDSVSPSNAPRPKAPPLSEEERKRLLSEGVTEDYIEARLSRAAAWGAKQGKRVYEVLLGWWREDKQARNAPRPTYEPGQPLSLRSYDLDEFFQDALEHTFDGI